MVSVRIDWWRLDEPGERDWLDPAEQARADRFVTPDLTARFIAGRAGLRARLGAAMGLAPGDVRLAEGPDGKPEIPGGPPFNLSHSSDYAVLALSDGAAVGVDVEVLRPVERDLAARYFSRAERAAIAAWPDATEGFHAVWTAKEAVMKGLGLGFKLPLSAFEVDARPGRAPALIRLDRRFGAAAEWTLARIDAPDGYAATLAARAATVRLARLEPGR